MSQDASRSKKVHACCAFHPRKSNRRQALLRRFVPSQEAVVRWLPVVYQMGSLLFLFATAIVFAPSAIHAADLGHQQGHTHGQSMSGGAEPEESTRDSRDEPEDGALQERHGREAVSSMAESHAHMGPHFRWTQPRPADPADQERAAGIVATLRRAIEPYRDYRKAIKDGYEPFLPGVPQRHYHFTSKWRGFKSAFRFHAEQPTSLLYKKTADGYELEGAMYTAPKRADENGLHKRIPLSVARWHAHVNICLPAKRQAKTANWKVFGPNGSIIAEGECDAVKGRWVPQLFGWMVHVYPFKDSPEQIWTH